MNQEMYYENHLSDSMLFLQIIDFIQEQKIFLSLFFFSYRIINLQKNPQDP